MQEDSRAELARRLRARRHEIEEAAFVRTCTLCDQWGTDDADYVADVRAAIGAACDAAINWIEENGQLADVERVVALPVPLAALVRRDARSRVKLDALLRRCAAVQLMLGEYIVNELDQLAPETRPDVLGLLSPLLDKLMALIADEYRRELERVEKDRADQRRTELVDRLLAGAPVDSSELDYELEATHLALIVSGVRAKRAAREIHALMGCQPLLVYREQHSVWMWLGSRGKLSAADVERAGGSVELASVSVALGEPGVGLSGWRLTHRQARAAQWVALHRPGELTRYADELLLAAALKDDVLARSLHDAYISPLNGRRDGGALARATLRAYFVAGCNAATAAASLGVDRHTVERRLRRIEHGLGRWINGCRAELELALRLDELSDGTRIDEPTAAAR
jgi:hypothetical protein